MMIMSKREKKKQQVETLRSFAKNKRKIMLKYSCLSVCICVCVSTQVEELTNFTRRAFWKKHLQNKKLYSNHIMPASGFDPANICQIPFVRPLNYNCKLTARLMVGPTTTITESSRPRLRLCHIAKDPLEENSKETSSLSRLRLRLRLVLSLLCLFSFCQSTLIYL